MSRAGTPTSAETIAYRGRPRDVADARAATRAALGDEGYAPIREEAVLAVSELVTNAVAHARGPLSLRILAEGDRVRLEVRDGSRDEPRPRQAAPGDTGGRGLAMVLRVTDAFGCDEHPDGKTVWCELAL